MKKASEATKELPPPKGNKEVPCVKTLEGRLAKLQPEQKAPTLRNQLRNAKNASEARQNERAEPLAVKERIQVRVGELQQSMAKFDRAVGNMDLEIGNLNQQVSVLVGKLNSQEEATPSPAQPGTAPKELSAADMLQMIIRQLNLPDTPEQVKAKLKQMD